MENRFETFTVLINRISRNIRKIKNQEMEKYNLRSAHISCLYYLFMNGGATATNLCECCEEDKATISRALLFLEDNGYLVCESRNAKRYRTPLLLTEKGTTVGKEIAEKINDILAEIGVGLTEDERIKFYHSLSVISEGLEKCADRTVSKVKK